MTYLLYILLIGLILYLIVMIKNKAPIIHKENNIIMEQNETAKPDYTKQIYVIVVLLSTVVWLLSEIIKRL